MTYRDLAAEPLSHLSGASFGGRAGAAPVPRCQKDIAAGQAALDEFLAADVIVIGAPMYNFTMPSQLKAWIDRIAVNGKTFRYTAAGPEGLAGNKRIIVAISRGGFYGAGAPAAAFEHLESYLKGVFGFHRRHRSGVHRRRRVECRSRASREGHAGCDRSRHRFARGVSVFTSREGFLP